MGSGPRRPGPRQGRFWIGQAWLGPRRADLVRRLPGLATRESQPLSRPGSAWRRPAGSAQEDFLRAAARGSASPGREYPVKRYDDISWAKLSPPTAAACTPPSLVREDASSHTVGNSGARVAAADRVLSPAPKLRVESRSPRPTEGRIMRCSCCGTGCGARGSKHAA
jgi:hypothetical protein